MKYLLLGDDYKKLFVEDDKQFKSFRYDPNKEQWVPGGTELFPTLPLAKQENLRKTPK